MSATSVNTIDTALFLSTAEALEPVTGNLSSLFAQWQSTLSTLRSEWQGDSSDDVKNTAAALDASSQALLKSLKGYQTALKELAGIYNKTEQSLKEEAAKSLKFGNLFQ